MNKQFNVVQVGLGPMGILVTNLLITRKNINLLGAIDIDPELKGKRLGDIIELSDFPDLLIESNLKKTLTDNHVDVVIIATASSLKKVSPIIKIAVQNGCNVISICEELSHPLMTHPNISKELDQLAKENNVSIIGTGINPGYLMDLLPIVLTAPCQHVESIKIVRMMNSGRRREPFQRKIGTGLTSNEFRRKIDSKEITGHVGLTESIHMIADALGFEFDEIKEDSPEAILTEKEFTTSYKETVKSGYVCGLRSTAAARKDGTDIIYLDFQAYAGDHDEYDSVIIEGNPKIEQKIIGGVHGDLGTSAMVVNLIPKIFTANPGLYTMKDLPVPCNTERIWKK
ncbi:MAG: NAD(P)H-dependent amine dehydrogenase family protein [Candidatus Kariarchaeaceae archaeon]|jgi:4-hydroxy-tetrahydrodipicolinate reductase